MRHLTGRRGRGQQGNSVRSEYSISACQSSLRASSYAHRPPPRLMTTKSSQAASDPTEDNRRFHRESENNDSNMTKSAAKVSPAALASDDDWLRRRLLPSSLTDQEQQPEAQQRGGRRRNCSQNSSNNNNSKSAALIISSSSSSSSSTRSNQIEAERFLMKPAATSRAPARRSPSSTVPLVAAVVSVVILLISAQSISCSMCQHYQAMLEAQQKAAAAATATSTSPQPAPTANQNNQNNQNLIICPKSSQFNNLPQFPQNQLLNSNQIKQQQEILKNLNASFSNYLQLNGPTLQPAASAGLPTTATLGNNGQAQPMSMTMMSAGQQLGASDLIDDELLNEIISPMVVDEAYARAKELLVKRRKLETELIRQGFTTDMSKPTAVARHQRVTTTTSRGNELEKAQEVFEEMSRILAKNLTNTINMRLATGNNNGHSAASTAAARSQLGQASQLGNGRTPSKPATGEPANGADSDQLDASSSELLERSDTNQLLARIDLHSSEARHAVSRCEEDQIIQCDPMFPYRHADGRCNNLAKPTWGKANTCFARLLPPEYSDGQSAPRISVTGHPLPNPRILSAIVHRDFNYPATYTHFVMQYGQFFAHDIAFTPSSRTKTGQMIQCCPIERDSHAQCFPILVPPDDPFYSNWEESCLNFVRTAVCPRCRLGPREQMNQITSFIDGSQVYGSAANETAALWTKSGPAGRMHVSFDDAGRELLPHSADPTNDQCSDVEKGQFCYRAGDRRVNQHPALTAVHVMWLRQHNRIVNGLKMANPHWNGDRLYQEAKRICAAQMQMVTYNEWLSLIIGQEAMKFLKLNVLPNGYTKYDPTVDPSLLNEFAGAAFRFGHSMINNIFAEILPDGRPSGYRLNEFFFHPFGIKSGQMDMVMRGLISQASQNRDPFMSSDIKNHLYRPRDNPYGLDLPAFNIQRGRDHGIPGYTKLVEFCFDDQISNWKQLDQYMPVSQRIRFSKLYRSVHDLDLFSAGLAEYPLPGAALGPTFTCIVGIQMFNLKFGDRFWFEHGGQVGSFTPDQVQEIRKTNLARLVCANSDNINVIQKNVFRGESPANPSVPCQTLPDLDLKAWMEEPGVQSVFSAGAAKLSEGETDEYKGKETGGNNKRDRRQRPQQEPLAYAFRGTRTSGKQSNSQGSLGSEYTLIQTHPMPQKPQPPPPYSNSGSGHPPPPPPPPMPAKQMSGNRYQGTMRNNKPQQYPNNVKPPFGMPAAKMPPRPPPQLNNYNQKQQPQQARKHTYRSSPARSMDQVLGYGSPHS